MIIAIKNTLDSVMNHKQMGKISTDEFNSIVAVIVPKIQASLFPEFRKLNYRKMRYQDTPNYGDEAFYQKQAQEYYIKEKSVNLTDGKAIITEFIEDYYLINSVNTEKSEAEKTDLVVFNKLNKLSELRPSTCLPIYTLNDNQLKLSPQLTSVDVVYFRKAKVPRLTSEVKWEKETFTPDASDFVDLDVHPMMMEAVFIELLAYYGINLKDEFAMQLSTQLKQEEQIKQQ